MRAIERDDEREQHERERGAPRAILRGRRTTTFALPKICTDSAVFALVEEVRVDTRSRRRS